MARPPAIEKVMYYPTDLESDEHQPVTHAIMSYIAPSEKGGVAFDPCCGKGTAIQTVGQLANCKTFGVELSYSRAEIAKARVDFLVQSAYSLDKIRMQEESIGLLWLNPPYDHNPMTGARMEEEFLQSATTRLARRGVLVFIIPQHIMGRQRVQRTLAGTYENIRVFRYPDPQFDVFKQIIVLATRRQKNLHPTKEDLETIGAYAEADLPPITKFEGKTKPYRVIDASRLPKLLKMEYEAEEQMAACKKEGVWATTDTLQKIYPSEANKNIRPVMPLRKGHIAMMLAAGMMGTLVMRSRDGHPMLVKGRAYKKKVETGRSESVMEGGERVTNVTYKDKFFTTIAITRKTGVHYIEELNALQTFMDTYAEQLAMHLQDTLKPHYNFDPTTEELELVRSFGKGRKPLPGLTEAGLLPAQEEVAIAAVRALKAEKSLYLQGEMGVGKSGIGATIMGMLHAFPAILMCPPHLVEKWKREILEVVPEAYVTELRMIGHQDGKDVNDVETFLQAYENGQLPERSVAIVANSIVWREAGWEPAVNTHTYKDRWEEKHTILTCPECGGPVKIPERGGNFSIPEVVEGQNPSDVMPAKPIRCVNTVKGHASRDGKKLYQGDIPIWGERTCNALLYKRKSDERRYSISTYILKRCRNRFKMLIADETHQFKSKSTDRGFAFHHLARSVKYSLCLTGTVFGGKSTSIFWLLHRTSKDVRDDFKFDDEKRWVKMYGVEEVKITQNNRSIDSDDYGYTGNYRAQNKASEKPGVSPAIASRVLPRTIFLALKDLGYQLPEYSEEAVVIPMSDEMSPVYHSMEAQLKAMAKKRKSMLSVYLQNTLNWPDASFRKEIIKANLLPEVKTYGTRWREKIKPVPTVIMEIDPIIQAKDGGLVQLDDLGDPILLPKEQWLWNYVLAEKQAGRKVLVYVRQTGERDIQDRIEDLLKLAGLRVGVLRSGGNTRKREQIVLEKSKYLDVLICNPRLVETGLDLVQFSTVIFYEIDYSLYTLWQSVRRVWRLGQTMPVQAIFTAYQGTMEEKALALMGQKMAAAQRLYGEEVSGAIVEDDDDDLMSLLAKSIRESDNVVDLQGIFSQKSKVSHSPIGELTKISAPIAPKTTKPQTVERISWKEWAAAKGVMDQLNKPKTKATASTQKPLF